MAAEVRRKTPEEYLLECQAEEQAAQAKQKGHLKIFLGYSSGVGKSFRMFDEARRRRLRGEDVVVGAVQPQVPPEAAPLLQQLEVIPLKEIAGVTAGVTSMDTNAVIRRHPLVCVIDGLAYDNPPGLRNAARWQDVQDLLDAGIQVIASVNIQYIAELRDKIEAITGKRAGQTVPLAFIQEADEIEIVDAPPAANLESPDHKETDHQQERLSKLRELALVVTADLVDTQLTEYLESHGIRQRFGAQERILVCVTPRANVQEMMEMARLTAARFHAELIVAYVKQANILPDDQAALDAKLAGATAAGARLEILEGPDPAAALLDYSRSHGITQLYVGHTQRRGLALLKRSPLDKLIRDGYGMDVCVFPQ